MSAERIPTQPWRRSSASFVISTFGLGAFSMTILIVASAIDGIQSLTVVVPSLAGLLFAGTSLLGWVAARWVRRAVVHGRSEGKAIWPVRAKSADLPRVRIGVLEADEGGLTVTIDVGEVRVGWADVATLEAVDHGPIQGRAIVVEGPHSARVELEILQPNAVARAEVQDRQKCMSILESFQTRALEDI